MAGLLSTQDLPVIVFLRYSVCSPARKSCTTVWGCDVNLTSVIWCHRTVCRGQQQEQREMSQIIAANIRRNSQAIMQLLFFSSCTKWTVLRFSEKRLVHCSGGGGGDGGTTEAKCTAQIYLSVQYAYIQTQTRKLTAVIGILHCLH